MGYVAAPSALDAAGEDAEILARNGEESVQTAGAGGGESTLYESRHEKTCLRDFHNNNNKNFISRG